MKKLSKRSNLGFNTITAFDLCTSSCQCWNFCTSHCGGNGTAQSAISSSLSISLYSDIKAYAG